MEREIKFRALQKDNKTFIYGDLAKMWNGIPFIMPKCFFATKDLGYDEEDPEEVKKMLNSKELALGGFIEVIPESVGQFTGLKDKNGKDIYEGDILKVCNGSINGNGWYDKPYSVEFKAGRWDIPLFMWDDNGQCIMDNTHWCEIIGNIHESPELLNN